MTCVSLTLLMTLQQSPYQQQSYEYGPNYMAIAGSVFHFSFLIGHISDSHVIKNVGVVKTF